MNTAAPERIIGTRATSRYPALMDVLALDINKPVAKAALAPKDMKPSPDIVVSLKILIFHFHSCG
jgi:hypothetical protein